MKKLTFTFTKKQAETIAKESREFASILVSNLYGNDGPETLEDLAEIAVTRCGNNRNAAINELRKLAKANPDCVEYSDYNEYGEVLLKKAKDLIDNAILNQM